jgi:arsenite methyltransferase
MTKEQLAKAERLRQLHDFRNVAYLDGYIEETGLEPDTADCVISNGVINLVPDKARVFKEAARLLRTGGRLAIADIVTDLELPDSIVCSADLWAACIGGAAQRERYTRMIERAGFEVRRVQESAEYRFISDRAQGAIRKFGVKSVSILAVKSG